MEAREYFEQLRERLINHKVSFRQLAANSLLVYIECEPGDQHGLTIWFDPTWHFCGPQGPLVGSRQAQIDDDEPDRDAALKQVGAPLAILIGKKIEDIKIEPRT